MDPFTSISHRPPDRKERLVHGRSLRKAVARVEQGEWKAKKNALTRFP